MHALEDEKLETAFLNHVGYKQGLEPYFDLYKVYETIRSDVVDKKKLSIKLGLEPNNSPNAEQIDHELLKQLFPELEEAHLNTQEKQLKSFNETVNYYRHANKKLPVKKLTIEACTSFINQLMRRWLDLKSNDTSVGREKI